MTTIAAPPKEAPLADRGNQGSEAAAAADGSVYIPPAKRRQLLEEAAKAEQTTKSSTRTAAVAATAAATNDSSVQQQQRQKQLQRDTWQTEKRIVHGTINRLNTATIKPLIHDLFAKVNLIRLRGVLAKSLLNAAVSSKQYAPVYAALVAVINTKLPEVGQLVVHRSILAFRRYYRRKEKASCLAISLFLAHLFHQEVVHELLILQLLTLLLEQGSTDDSVEIAVQLLKTVGQALLEVSPAGVRAVLERLRALLHEGRLHKRVQLQVEQLLVLRKSGFEKDARGNAIVPIPQELDLVERDDQITFETSLDEEDVDKESHLDVFSYDEKFEEHQDEWKQIRAEILGLSQDDDDDDDGERQTDDDSESGSDDDDDESEEAEDGTIGDGATDQESRLVPASSSQVVTIQDMSEADLVHLRRTIYLTIMSSATFEECTHKLAKIDIPRGREEELVNMVIECCSQERTFLRYYGLIAARFCLLDDRWRDAFLNAFVAQYTTIHRLETNKLRNVAKLFAHLLHTDSVPWSCLGIVHLNEDETTSSSRIFVKILVQEMAEAMGIAKLKSRFETQDPIQKDWFKGMFPQDNVRNTRYAINFFTSIGLGPLTDGLREFLKNAPKMILAQQAANANRDDDDSSVSSSSSSSSSSSGSVTSSSTYTSSSSSSYSSDSRDRKRSRKYRRSRRRSRSYSSDSSTSYSSRGRSRSRSENRSRSPSTDTRRESTREDGRRDDSRSRSAEKPVERAGEDTLPTGEDTRDGRDRRRKRSRSTSSSRSSSSLSSRGDRRKRTRRQSSYSS